MPQLHIHIVARREDDPLWLKPVWGLHEVRAGGEEAFARFVGAMRVPLIADMDSR